MLYDIYAGMSGGFGGAVYHTTEDFDTEDEACKYAFDLAWEDYESYAGMHGILSWAECYEEATEEMHALNEEWDESYLEEYANDLYQEEVEGWIEYWADPHIEDHDE